MTDTYTDTAGILRDQIPVIVTDASTGALGVYAGDTALKVVLTDTYVANDGTLQEPMPVFYPGTDTYEDSAGVLRDTVLMGSAPSVDFTGLTAGSVAGDVETTGSLPTGWDYSLDGVSITVDEATHDAGGVECITITVEIAAVGEGIIYFPDFQPAAEGETWRVYLHVASMENTDMETAVYGVAEFDGADAPLDFNSEQIAEGLNEFSRQLGVTVEQARGEIFFSSLVPSSLTMTFAAKLEQVS